MRILRFYPLLILFIFINYSCIQPQSSTYQKPVTNSKAVEEISNKTEENHRVVTTEPKLINQKPFHTGEITLKPSGETQYIFSKLYTQITNNQLFINDKQWPTHFEDDTKNRKVVFFSTQRGNEPFQSFENLNFTDLKGYAFAPIITYLDKNEFWRGKKFVQPFFYIPADTTISIYQLDNQQYFIKPPQLTFHLTSHLPQYYKSFPNYELPKSKIGVNMFKTLDMNAEAVLARGNSLAPIASLPKEKQVIYDYDDWLYKSGCPKAYSVSNEEVSKWLENVNEQQLLQNFIEHFYNRYKDYGYVAMDFEAISGGFYGKGIYKIEKCLNYWKTHPHTAQLAICGYKGVGLSRIYIEGNNEARIIESALNFKGTIEQFLAIYKENPFQTNSVFEKYIDFHQVGNYLNYPVNYGYIHHFLIENELSKKYFPSKKNIVNFWHNQEYVGDFELGWTYFKLANGKPLKKYIKPVTFPDAMYNAAVWAFSLADGGEIWSEPYPRTNNIENYGWGGNTYSMNDEQQPDKFGPEFSIYAEQNFQNIDWWEAGKWAVSQNADIIEANTQWEFISSKRENENWTSEKTKLPHFSLYEKTPLVAIKFDKNKQNALVLVYDAWNNPLKKQTIEVMIQNKKYVLFQIGRYSSVVRIKL